MKLARVTYLSAAKPALPFWQTTSEIVGASQARNTQEDLTGVLLAHNGWFVQCLEGLPSRLTRLLVRIGTDPRHTGMQLIEFGEARERMFADWAMAHVELTPHLAREVGDHFDPRNHLVADLLKLLTSAHGGAQVRTA